MINLLTIIAWFLSPISCGAAPTMRETFQQAEQQLPQAPDAGQKSAQEVPLLSGESKSYFTELPCRLRDAAGRFYSDMNAALEKQHFTVKVDGEKQEVAYLRSEAQSVSLGYVFDGTGSMAAQVDGVSNMQYAADILRHFFEVHLGGDEYAMGIVKSTPKMITEHFTRDIDPLRTAIAFEKPDGMTALYDTLQSVVSLFSEAHNSRQAIIIVSDGQDNVSQGKLGQLMKELRKKGILVFAIIVPGTELEWDLKCKDQYGTLQDTGKQIVRWDGDPEIDAAKECAAWQKGLGQTGGGAGVGLPGIAVGGSMDISGQNAGYVLEPPQGRPRGLSQMQDIIKVTGGWVFDTRNPAQVQDAYIAAQIFARFDWILGFNLDFKKNKHSNRRVHDVEVKLDIKKGEYAKVFPQFKGKLPADLQLFCASEIETKDVK